MDANHDNRRDFELLHSAALQVDDSLRLDDNLSSNVNTTSDLKDLLQSPRSGAVKYFIRSPTKITDTTQAMGASEDRVQQIEESLCIPIPQGIREQLRQRDDIIASFTGILPEINRVWITIDNVIYFWNYLYGDDYLVYEGIHEVVYSVKVVCPRSDTFNDSVAYLLVVVTPVEVALLAVVRDSDIADHNGVFQMRSIQPTKYTVPSDNLTFLAIAGSTTGRIFLAGSDCNLYEFEYKNEESSWSYLLGIGPDFTCKKRKYNCGGSIYSFFSFLSSDEDVLQDLVVDDVRRLLYAISKLGKINVFYLPPDASPKMVINTNIIEKAKMKRTVPVRYKHDEVHSIFVIPVEESEKLHGMIVLNSGIRLYFSIKVRSYPFTPQVPGSTVMPSDLDVEHIRLPVQSEQIEALKRANHSQDEGFPAGLPNADPSSRRRLSKALYSYGSYFTALEDTGSGENILINAKMEWTGNTVREDNNYELKENLCALRHSVDGALFTEKVEDIKEACNHLLDLNTSKLNRLFFASKPDQYNTSGTSTAKKKSIVRTDLEPVPGSAPCLPYLSRGTGYGYDNDDLLSLQKLTELSFQMSPSLAHTKRQFLILTNKALYIVTQSRPIDYLYALLQIGVDMRTLCEGISRRLFDYYGLSQCSAMCVAIACDLPRDVSSLRANDHSFSIDSEVHESLKYNAIAVMKELGNIHAPLVPLMNAPSSNASTNSFQQQLQTPEHSTTYYALYQIFSRIMRPIWYRVFVQMRTENGHNIYFPLLDSFELEAIKRPLQKLVDVLRNWHQDAIDNQGNGSITTGIGGGVKSNRGAPTGMSSQRYRENEIRLAENKALNTFYRLLTRTLQAVSMMQILIEADEVYKLCVEWERMYDNDDAWTFKKIVTMGDYHDKIKSVLKDLVCVNTAARRAVGRTDTEYITKKLASECFQYFSIGDVHHYRGSNELNRALAAPHNSNERDQHTISAIEEMCKAAVYWRSMVDVTTVNNVISPLESTCNLLLNLGEIGQEGIVSVCMSCARGFGGGDNDRQVIDAASQSSSWEKSLYHSGSVCTVEDRYKAKKACYAALLQRIAQVQEREFMTVGAGINNYENDAIQATDRNVKAMIDKSIDITKDLDYHTMLYNFLISNQLDDYLLTLDTIYVENYLAEKDKMKLYQYYELHKRYYEAMELMTNMATVDKPTPLVFRIECLAKAVRSADSACRNPDLRFPRNTVDALNDRTDCLRMAEFQLRLAEILDGKAEEASRLREEADRANHQGVMQIDDPNMRRLQELIHKAKNTLMTDDEMFKEITVPFDLWEESLEIIHGCNHEDESLVKTLWRSIIFSIIPTSSNVPELRNFVEKWRRLHDNIFIDRMREKPGVLIEHTDGYMQELGVKIRDLGKILNADDGGFVFPLIMLIEDLEKLVITLNRRVGFTLRTFAMDIFRGIGIKHSVLMEAYVSTARRQNLSNANNWDLVQLAWAASDLVVGWTKLASNHGPSEETQAARTSLRMEIRSGRMRQWLKNGLRDSIQRAESLLYNGDADYITYLKEAKDKIDEATEITDRFALG